MLFIDGVPYSASQAANVVTYVNSRGCDSLVNYYVNNVKLTGNIVAVPFTTLWWIRNFYFGVEP